MGYIRHHAMLVTGSCGDWVERAHAKALKLSAERDADGLRTPPIVGALSDVCVNGTQTFAIYPDGSKEGWTTSDQGNVFRERLVEWLEEQRYEDGSSPLDWVEVQYGDDNRETKVCRDSDERYRG